MVVLTSPSVSSMVTVFSVVVVFAVVMAVFVVAGFSVVAVLVMEVFVVTVFVAFGVEHGLQIDGHNSHAGLSTVQVRPLRSETSAGVYPGGCDEL